MFQQLSFLTPLFSFINTVQAASSVTCIYIKHRIICTQEIKFFGINFSSGSLGPNAAILAEQLELIQTLSW